MRSLIDSIRSVSARFALRNEGDDLAASIKEMHHGLAKARLQGNSLLLDSSRDLKTRFCSQTRR